MLKVLKKLFSSAFRNLFMISIFLYTFFILFSPIKLFALNASDVATVDMHLVLNLHPKMALFDFNREGFYKVDLGLTYEQFEKAINNLKANSKDNKEKIKKLEDELNKLINESAEYQRNNINNLQNMEKYIENMNIFSLKQEKLIEKINNLKWEFENNDLTSRDETKNIMFEIKKEIYEVVDEIVKENKYKLVANVSIIAPYKFNYGTVELFGYQGIPGVNLSLYHAFELLNYQKKIEIQKHKNINEERYLQLAGINYNSLPITNYPVVLAGGKSITSEVIKRIYTKYNIDTSSTKLIPSVISRIEALQFGKELEKLEILEKAE